MYATCLYCNNALGSIEVVETFPVGRRLAFDQAKGRLWVVCRKCEKWNLSPLEERWEAIEEAERAFRGTKLRVSTEHIGLAKLKVEQDDLRPDLSDEGQRLLGRAGPADHLEVWLVVERGDEALTDDRVVVHHQDADHWTSSRPKGTRALTVSESRIIRRSSDWAR